MGLYLNPGNDGFAEMLRSDYVDKTEMIGLLNNTIGTRKKLTCVSRPRRFGKSYAAQMLCAYYDKTCESHELFDKCKIAQNQSYEEHIGKYDVIYVDMTGVKPFTQNFKNLVPFLTNSISKEILDQYPHLQNNQDFLLLLLDTVKQTGNKFVIIIDEWDAPIRETPEVQEEYLEFLRALFKNSGFTSKVFAAAYMTGILPIKKDGKQSAVSDFEEYSVLAPGDFAEFVGFTEDEVRELCEKHQESYSKMKRWYDGYTFGKQKSIYNPYSVMKVISTGKFESYWKKTSAAETLMTYIDMNQEGLQEDIARLITGESILVNTDTFQNDVETFNCKDDVLTMLVHLGYLTYETSPDLYNEEGKETTGFVRIPNEEVRSEFEMLLRRAKHSSLIELIQKSDQLLRDTLNGEKDAVAKAIQEVHEMDYAPTFYNNEQSLRYTVKMAYISCVDQYLKIQELPSGRGMADLVFLPKLRSSLPVMVIELKWEKTEHGAIQQIKEKKYPKVLENYGGKIVLVGINYDTRTKEHSCEIEEHQKVLK